MIESKPRYDERLSVPLRWWVQATMLVASVWLAMIVALPEPAAWSVTALAGALAVTLLTSWGSARVQVDDGWFRAGRARIEGRWIGAVQPLDAEQTRRAAGVDADARAFLLLRPYLKQSVRVGLTDPDDPTPYWLVNTRRPEALAAALGALPRSGDDADRVNPHPVQED